MRHSNRISPSSVTFRIAPEGVALIAQLDAAMRAVLELPLDTLGPEGVPSAWNLSHDQYPLDWAPVVERHRQAAQKTRQLLLRRTNTTTSEIAQKVIDAVEGCSVIIRELSNLPPVVTDNHPACLRTMVRWMRHCSQAEVLEWLRTQPLLTQDGGRIKKLTDAMGWNHWPSTGVTGRKIQEGGKKLHPWRAQLSLVALAVSSTLSEEFLMAMLAPEHALLNVTEVVAVLRARASGSAADESLSTKEVFMRETWWENIRQVSIGCLPEDIRTPHPQAEALGYLLPLATYQLDTVLAFKSKVKNGAPPAVRPLSSSDQEEPAPVDPTEDMANICLAMRDSTTAEYGTPAQWRELMEKSLGLSIKSEWYIRALSLVGLHRLTAPEDEALRRRLLEQVRHSSYQSASHQVGVYQADSYQSADKSDLFHAARLTLKHTEGREISRPVRRALRCVMLHATAHENTVLNLQQLETVSNAIPQHDELRPLIGALILRSSTDECMDAWDQLGGARTPCEPHSSHASPVGAVVRQTVEAHAKAQRRVVGIGVVADLWIRQVEKTERPVCSVGDPLWKHCCEKEEFWSVLIACGPEVTAGAPDGFWRLALQRPSRAERQLWIRRMPQRTTRREVSGVPPSPSTTATRPSR